MRRAERVRDDPDPALGWCLGDVVGRPDRRSNLYPVKQRPEQKIDAAVALLMAVDEGDFKVFLRDPVIA